MYCLYAFHIFLWRCAFARNVRLRIPHWLYTKRFIFRFVCPIYTIAAVHYLNLYLHILELSAGSCVRYWSILNFCALFLDVILTRVCRIQSSWYWNCLRASVNGLYLYITWAHETNKQNVNPRKKITFLYLEYKRLYPWHKKWLFCCIQKVRELSIARKQADIQLK